MNLLPDTTRFDEPRSGLQSRPDDFAVIGITPGLIVVDKPAGMLCVPGRGPDKADCLLSRVLAGWPDALLVHRLDMATSGLVVMARGKSAQSRLSIAFRDRKVGKRYVAIVAGHPAQDAGEIELPIGPDWPNRPRQKVDREAGKASLTRYRVMAYDSASNTSRIELEPVTGRTHQLRLHLMAIGHPILGDALYAPDAIASAAPRLLLHAQQLVLPHESDSGVLLYDSPPPF